MREIKRTVEIMGKKITIRAERSGCGWQVSGAILSDGIIISQWNKDRHLAATFVCLQLLSAKA